MLEQQFIEMVKWIVLIVAPLTMLYGMYQLFIEIPRWRKQKYDEIDKEIKKI